MDQAAFVRHFETSFPDLVGKKVLVGLSGGGDSVALLHLLRCEEIALELEAAHVHHGVRGDEADRDALFCETLCANHGVGFHLLRIDPDQPRTAGREGTWRQLRYATLGELKRNAGFEAVATGHHRDDVAEGVLVQLLRGCGPRALAGIADRTPDGIIRPLLPWSRTEIRVWLESHEFSWREDSSNSDLDHLRNRVRHRILPELEDASPALRRHLIHLAETHARDEEYFSRELIRRETWIDPWHPEGGVPVTEIATMPRALRTRWLHAQAHRIDLPRVTRRQAQLFETLINGSATAVTLGARWRLRVAGGKLWLEPPQAPLPYEFELRPGQCIDLPLPGWRTQLIDSQIPASDSPWRFPVDGRALLVMRSPRSGDLVRVEGRSVRITKLLARALPRHLRNAWPVCCENDRIQWIPGVWRGAEPATRTSYVVEVMRRERSSCVV